MKLIVPVKVKRLEECSVLAGKQYRYGMDKVSPLCVCALECVGDVSVCVMGLCVHVSVCICVRACVYGCVRVSLCVHVLICVFASYHQLQKV